MSSNTVFSKNGRTQAVLEFDPATRERPVARLQDAPAERQRNSDRPGQMMVEALLDEELLQTMDDGKGGLTRYLKSVVDATNRQYQRSVNKLVAVADEVIARHG